MSELYVEHAEAETMCKPFSFILELMSLNISRKRKPLVSFPVLESTGMSLPELIHKKVLAGSRHADTFSRLQIDSRHELTFFHTCRDFICGLALLIKSFK